MDLNFLIHTELFYGTKAEELQGMLTCLNGVKKEFKKGEYIYHAGDCVSSVGVVLEGSVTIESDDLWGNKSVIHYIVPGEIFGEAYAALPNRPLLVSAVANENTKVLFLNIGKMLRVCSSNCRHHQQLIQNLLGVLAEKNIRMSNHMQHTSPKTIRGRLLSYFSEQAAIAGKNEITIPFNRQQLADYLNVDRSSMSHEIGKMQKEGLLQVKKNTFYLKE